MKKRMSVYLKILVTCAALTLVLAAVFGISVGLSTAQPVNEPEEKIPYYTTEAPEEYGLLISFEGGGSIFFCFDRLGEETSVILLENLATRNNVAEFGYEVDAACGANYDFLAELIDRFGGIELNTDTDGRLKYTGVQVTEMLSRTTDREFRRRVAERLCENMKESGVTNGDMLFLLENTENQLSYPDLYYLPDTVNAALSSVVFVN